jgi:dipeptidyl-peptidase-4
MIINIPLRYTSSGILLNCRFLFVNFGVMRYVFFEFYSLRRKVMAKRRWIALSIIVLFLAVGAVSSDKFVKTPLKKGKLTIEERFVRPFIWGTAPSSVKWSKEGSKLSFLWNDKGERFCDLYLVTYPEGKRVRLTDMKKVPELKPEEDKRTEEEKKQAELLNPGITGYDFSKDGSKIIFSYQGDIYLVEAKEKGEMKPVIRSLEGEGDPGFFPDGVNIAYTKGGNLFRFNLERGEIIQLTTLPGGKGTIDSYLISPDGKWIALFVVDRSMWKKINVPDYYPEEVKVKTPRRQNVGEPLPISRLGFIPASGGTIKWVDFDDNRYYLQEWEWLPDSSALIFNWNDKDWQDWKVYLIDPEKLEKNIVYQEEQKPWFWTIEIEPSGDGKTLFFTSEKSGFRHLYALSLADGKLSQLTDGGFDVLSFTVCPKGDKIVYSSSEVNPLERHLFSLSLADLKKKRLSVTPGSYHEFPSPDGKFVIANYSSATSPNDLYLIKPAGKMDQLTHSPLPAFDKMEKAKPRYFSFKNEEDGKTIHGYLLYPKNFDKEKKYPAVLSCVYADIGKNEWVRYSPLDFYMVNEMGYFIVRVDFRGSVGYGKDFHYGYYNSLGIVDAKEAVSCANYLKTLPYIDGDKLGIWGGSYGGFLTLMVMCDHPGVFDTGVSWKPVTDWHNYWDSYTSQRLGRPKEGENEKIFQATSPRFHAKGFKGNLHLIHGMQDVNVLFQDTVWMIQEFIDNGKYFDLMIYPRDNHMMTLHDPDLPDLMKRIGRYFEDHFGVGGK